MAWVDYHANLAVVTTSDEDFWKGLQPAKLGGAIPADGGLQILRWRNGNLENRRAEFTQFIVREGQLSTVSHVSLEADCEIQGASWGEPVVADSHVVGVVNAQLDRTCVAIPTSYIQSILEARKSGQYHGLGYFHFYWQPAANPASLARLGLTGEPRGVIVIQVGERPDRGEQVLKPQDIILNIDGFDIDIQGDYEDPEYGHLMLENLATRGKWAGDDIKMKIWRDGKPLEVTYRLPKYDYSTTLVPFATMITSPSIWSPAAWSSSPSRIPICRVGERIGNIALRFGSLSIGMTHRARTDRRWSLMSQVLPDPYNVGYQDHKGLVVDKVNGQRISKLSDLRQALEKPVDGFHIIEFVQSDSLRKIILAAGDPEKEATARILRRYGINEPFHFLADSTQ